jgi:SAGA-associated factor 29
MVSSLLVIVSVLSFVCFRCLSLTITYLRDKNASLGVHIRPEAPPSELAVAVARDFESMEVNEEDCIGGFLERLEKGSANTEYARETCYFDGKAVAMSVRKRQRSKMAARPGEQVAAKVTRTDENGSWILASVQRFYSDTETYDVQDEDDTSKLIRLPWNHVMRLSMGAEGTFQKGTDCMAIFPETTSFYRAKVSKSPVWKLDSKPGSNPNALTTSTSAGSAVASSHHNMTPIVKEMIVKFEDDEDANGRTPHRRVPARYVIPIPSDYFYDSAEDVDLTLPGTSQTSTTTSTAMNRIG